MGFVLLGAALVAGAIIGMLFVIPESSFLGMTAVNERDTQIIYRDTVLATAFADRNFVIESETVNVEIIMQKNNQMGEGTIVVNESAAGLSFNDIGRTHIEWTQVLVGSVVYCKIKILEPVGAINQQKPTTVYINLPPNSETFNFVLDNKRSTVNFSFGDYRENNQDQLHIGTLTVKSAKQVKLPAYTTMDVADIFVDGDNLDLDCKADVTGAVTVNGSGGRYNFEKIGGDVTVGGRANYFTAAKDVGGDVQFNGESGELKLFGSCGNLRVRTENANINANTVSGGVDMQTVNGNLSVNSITDGGLNVTAIGKASVSVRGVKGETSINNGGVGSINLEGVRDSVHVISNSIGGGAVNVVFDTSSATVSAEPDITISGYDGDITVRNICGPARISVRDPIQLGTTGGAAGKANIYASFSKVVGENNTITAGGYVNPGNLGIANVTVKLSSTVNPFTLRVQGSSSAWDYFTTPGGTQLSNDSDSPVNNDENDDDNPTPRLVVTTPAKFELR
jgi:hypothetical protein